MSANPPPFFICQLFYGTGIMAMRNIYAAFTDD
jgi:hypothetical protein